MEHCPSKTKSYKHKGGKCCCGPSRTFKKLQYATISNRTPTSGTGAAIAFTPDGSVQNLWSGGTLTPSVTCKNGPLQSWFNTATGLLTIQETGLYEVTISGDFDPNTANLATTVPAFMSVRINYANVVNEASRCLNSLVLPTGKSSQESLPASGSNDVTASTVTATMILLQGDILQFQSAASLTGVSVNTNFLYQIDIVQLARADSARVLAGAYT